VEREKAIPSLRSRVDGALTDRDPDRDRDRDPDPDPDPDPCRGWGSALEEHAKEKGTREREAYARGHPVGRAQASAGRTRSSRGKGAGNRR
jgi:hypothetical protein